MQTISSQEKLKLNSSFWQIIEALTVEKNDAANGEVEKDSRPLRRIDHGQNNRHNKNQNFNK